MAYVVGLTGGIGSGKTTVADAFARLGVEIVDTDQLAHRVSAAGEPGFVAIRDALPDVPLQPNGEIDRAALRRIVFADPIRRLRLEKALHPVIGSEAKRQIARWTGTYGLVVVPLLLEREGLRSVVDRVLVVDCPEDEQVRRVAGRSGLAPGEVRAIMSTQLSREHRLASADDVIDNGGAPEAIGPQVSALDLRYRELAAARCTS